MRLPHAPETLARLRVPSPQDPWRVLISGCIFAWPCGVDATDYGMGGENPLRGLPTIRFVPFCPEEHGMGTPRTMPDLHGGDGFAVLRGQARVLDEQGRDLTTQMLRGARAMLRRAQQARVDWALLTDMSAACGSQVISAGCRFDQPRRFQQGVGVATAVLLQGGIPVVSQRDHQTLGVLRAMAEPGYLPDPLARDHHQHPWTLATFGGGGEPA